MWPDGTASDRDGPRSTSMREKLGPARRASVTGLKICDSIAAMLSRAMKSSRSSASPGVPFRPNHAAATLPPDAEEMMRISSAKLRPRPVWHAAEFVQHGIAKTSRPHAAAGDRHDNERLARVGRRGNSRQGEQLRVAGVTAQGLVQELPRAAGQQQQSSRQGRQPPRRCRHAKLTVFGRTIEVPSRSIWLSGGVVGAPSSVTS